VKEDTQKRAGKEWTLIEEVFMEGK